LSDVSDFDGRVGKRGEEVAGEVELGFRGGGRDVDRVGGKVADRTRDDEDGRVGRARVVAINRASDKIVSRPAGERERVRPRVGKEKEG
jgi:hypothetical protein